MVDMTLDTSSLSSNVDFSDIEAIACIIGDSIVPAVTVDMGKGNATISCRAPPFPLGKVEVGVSLNGKDRNIAENVFLNYVADPIATNIYPTSGPITGETVVHIYGEGMVDGMTCRFGDAVVLATYHSDDHISCISSAQTYAGSVFVSVSVNAFEYVSTGVSFRYVAMPTVKRVSPLSGPETGNSRVYIHASGIGSPAPIMCQFGTSKNRVPVVRESDGVISCLAPSHAPGEVAIELSYNGQQWTSLSDTFTYHSLISVFKVEPVAGSVAGGDVVVISGTNFDDVPTLSCKFDGLITPARYIDNMSISCRTPQMAAPGI